MAAGNSLPPLTLDFDRLRAEGIRRLQRLSAGQWTDFNTHDPGLTLLEVLCYALTDLAYRTGYSVPDLLGKEGVSALRERYGPAQVMPGAPVSYRDLRRLILDSAEAPGARLEPVSDANPRLFYHPYDRAISIAPVEGALGLNPQGLLRAFTGSGAEKVRAALFANRPLCSDWYEIKDMGTESILIKVELELTPDTAQPEIIAGAVFRALSEAITPSLNFQRQSEAQRQGNPADLVYEGPLLAHGYLADTELAKLEQRDFLRASDLIQVLMDVPGVMAVKNIRMGDKGERWLLPLTPGKYPSLATNSVITLFRSTLREEFTYSEKYLVKDEVRSNASELSSADQTSGTDRKIAAYFSIRNHLPATYGLSTAMLPADIRRQTQVQQLSAYLLFFEQILADYLAQLAQTRALFEFDATLQSTYTLQVLRHVPGALALFGFKEGVDEAAFIQDLQEDLQQYAEPAPAQRLNRLLDHLLARFAENFADYALLVSGNKELSDQLPQIKRDFLSEYSTIGLHRGTGCDYRDPTSRSGLEHRVARLLGLPWPPADQAEPGKDNSAMEDALGRGDCFFLVEHILLRPVPKDSAGGEDDYLLTDVGQVDPYSRQLTFVFPNYSARFSSGEAWDAYWKLVLTTLRRETPAHLKFNCLSLDLTQLSSFSTAYQSWRQALANPAGFDNNTYRVARDWIIDLLVETKEKTPPRFLLGWSRPILDLQVKVPVVAPGTRVPVILVNSQARVVYTLCDWVGDPVKDETGKIITASGTGNDLEVLLPALTKDTTFLLKAQKNIPGQTAPSEGFLRQKLRVRVGIDTKIPIMVLDQEIDYNTTARIRANNTQAEVRYILMNPQNATIPPEVEGKQGDFIDLLTQKLTEDITFRIQATRTFNAIKDNQMIEGSYPVQVRPNPDLNAAVNNLIIPYNTPAALSIELPQSSAKYQVFTRVIRDTEFINSDLPASWTASKLAASLSALNLNANTPVPPDFTAFGTPVAGSGNKMVINTGILQEDVRFLLFAKKDGHKRGVILTKSIAGAVLVLPNQDVQATLSKTEIESGEVATIQIPDPQPGVWYKLYKKGSTTELDAVYYHNVLPDSSGEDGIESVRLEFDFFMGQILSPPLTLSTPPLDADTQFEVVAEKVQTGLRATLKASISVTVKPAVAHRSVDAPPPDDPSGKRNRRKKDKE